MSGLYIHIPFCKQACYYCDFHFSTSLHLRRHVLSAIQTELVLQKDYLKGVSIQSIYFGGGTPSLLTRNELSFLFNTIYENYPIQEQAEITLEVNPDDVSGEKLTDFKALGINRISLGVQSFHNTILRKLNRSHSCEQIHKALYQINQCGFSNVNIDLIHAIPGQSIEIVQKDLETSIRYKPSHISTYGLTIEPKTVFGYQKKKGLLKPMTETDSAVQFEYIMNSLEDHGYQQYEISNFCLPGYIALHNSRYWKQFPYLGIGPGAHSYNGTCRQQNIANNPIYVKSLAQNIIPYKQEWLTLNQQINEYILTSLRTQWGCSITTLKKRYHYQIDPLIPILSKNNLIYLKNDTIFLSQKGKLIADNVITHLLI